MKNSNTTLEKMASEVGLSSSGVRRRVKRLEEEDVIKGYTAKVDPTKAGYNVAAYLDIDVKSRFFRVSCLGWKILKQLSYSSFRGRGWCRIRKRGRCGKGR